MVDQLTCSVNVENSHATRHLLALKARAERIVETAPDAFIGFDLEGLIVDWNTQATALFGWSREAAIGRSLWGTIMPSPATKRIAREILFPKLPGKRRRGIIDSSFQRDIVTATSFLSRLRSAGPSGVRLKIFSGPSCATYPSGEKREEELRQAKEAAESHSEHRDFEWNQP